MLCIQFPSLLCFLFIILLFLHLLFYVLTSLLWLFYAYGSFFTHRFPIVEPDPGHTKLRLAREGLDAIEKITSPIAAVAVRSNS